MKTGFYLGLIIESVQNSTKPIFRHEPLFQSIFQMYRVLLHKQKQIDMVRQKWIYSNSLQQKSPQLQTKMFVSKFISLVLSQKKESVSIRDFFSNLFSKCFFEYFFQ